VKEWTRGTPIEDAVTVYEAEHDDIAATGMSIGQGACEMRARPLAATGTVLLKKRVGKVQYP
jgi:prolyl oligopeptidase PreP (S9A serine peptidase family)